MRILSFDIGIKNFSFCDVECSPSEYIIHAWDVIDITNGVQMDMHTTAEALIKLARLYFLENPSLYDHIVIENQPVMKNPIMKSLQMVLYTSFKYVEQTNPVAHYKVHFVNASNKGKCIKMLGTQEQQEVEAEAELALGKSAAKNKAYIKRKKMGILIAERLLKREVKCPIYILEKFINTPKKDDYCDTMLMAFYFHNTLCALQTI